MFRTVPLSIIRRFSLYTQQWYMSYSLRAGSGRNYSWAWAVFLCISCYAILPCWFCTVFFGVPKLICFLCLFGIDEFDVQVTVHLFGFIIRIYHDARSPERQMHYVRYLYIMDYLSACCEVGNVTYLKVFYKTRRRTG